MKNLIWAIGSQIPAAIFISVTPHGFNDYTACLVMIEILSAPITISCLWLYLFRDVNRTLILKKDSFKYLSKTIFGVITHEKSNTIITGIAVIQERNYWVVTKRRYSLVINYGKNNCFKLAEDFPEEILQQIKSELIHNSKPIF